MQIEDEWEINLALICNENAAQQTIQGKRAAAAAAKRKKQAEFLININEWKLRIQARYNFFFFSPSTCARLAGLPSIHVMHQRSLQWLIIQFSDIACTHIAKLMPVLQNLIYYLITCSSYLWGLSCSCLLLLSFYLLSH
jgi:hypothetical protein